MTTNVVVENDYVIKFIDVQQKKKTSEAEETPRRKARMPVSEYPFLEKWFYEFSFSCFFSLMLDCEKVLYYVVQMNRGKFQPIA